jgi:hypothetical protein
LANDWMSVGQYYHMKDLTQDLTKTTLRENFKYWVSKFVTRNVPAKDSTRKFIPATHTFPFFKKTDVAQEILLNDQALLAAKVRRRGTGADSGREMMEARSMNLHEFVFSYLGAHDPYYAKIGRANSPGFGVFIKRDIEEFPSCNATRRDLASKEAEKPFEREFLLPSDARSFACLQALNDKRHSGDFWHYWGDPKYLREVGYLSHQWEWKVEIHFHEKVEVDDFEAIIWPYHEVAIGAGKKAKKVLGDVDAFQKTFPKCKTILYNWENPSERTSLFIASNIVANYFVEHREYPDELD